MQTVKNMNVCLSFPGDSGSPRGLFQCSIVWNLDKNKTNAVINQTFSLTLEINMRKGLVLIRKMTTDNHKKLPFCLRNAFLKKEQSSHNHAKNNQIYHSGIQTTTGTGDVHVMALGMGNATLLH